MSMSRKKILFLAQFALLLAIELIFCFTPLGSIPIVPGLVVATLAMVPVVITAILLGTGAGAAMGFVAGLCSFLVWSFITPAPTSFVFTPIPQPARRSPQRLEPGHLLCSPDPHRRGGRAVRLRFRPQQAQGAA